MNYDQDFNVVSQDGVNTRVIQGGSYYFNIQGLMIGADTVEQATKFYTYMNMYQEFQYVNRELTYIPKFTGTDQNAYNTLLPTIMSGQYEPEEGKAYLTAIANMNTSEVTYLPDADDREMRWTMNEYTQVRGNPMAKTFKLNQPWSITFYPTTTNVVWSPGDQVGFQSTPPVNSYSGDRLYNLGLNATSPMRVPWLCTKINYKLNATNVVQFNIADNWMGYKMYVYMPDNDLPLPNGGVNAVIGILRQKHTFRFRKPDFRGWLAIPPLTTLLSDVNPETVLDPEIRIVDGKRMRRTRAPEEEATFIKRVKTGQQEAAENLERMRSNNNVTHA